MKVFAVPLAILATCTLTPSALIVAGGGERRSTGRTPVERVVNLLKDLASKLEADEKTEQQVYYKYACFCETVTARKAKTITDASDDLRAFGQGILSLKGLVATRASEVEQLATDIKENEEAQAQATTIREKQNAAFMTETAELKQATSALQQALTVLVAGTKPAFLQSSTKAKLLALLADLPASTSMKWSQVALLGDYLRGGSSAKYLPQSLTVQGILSDMYQTFARDLEGATEAEANANSKFEAFISEKATQAKEMKAEKKKKEAEKAEAEQMLADNQAMYDDTAAQKTADVAFFDETAKACKAKHEEWTTRSSLRAEELSGIKEALTILSSDSARQLFASAIKPGKETGAEDEYDTGRNISLSFLQLDGQPADRAYMALKSAATHGHSLRLAAVAAQLKTSQAGHFDKVLQSIDNVIQALKDEDLQDIKKRDQCTEEYHQIESTVKDLDWKVERNVAKIDKLTKLIELRTEQKASTVQDISDLEAQVAAITAERRAENNAFLKAKKDDQEAIDLLMQARTALTKFYKSHKIDMGEIQGSVNGVLFQEPVFNVSEDQAPNATFSDKDHRVGETKGAVSILTMIIEDLNDEIKNGMKSEEVAQLDFEKQMAAASKLKQELVAKRDSLEAAIAQRSGERTDQIVDKEANEQSLKEEHEYKQSITKDCDWIIGAFDKRSESRRAEMEGLVRAKEFLVGYQNSQALLETKAKFDDGALAKIHFLGLRH